MISINNVSVSYDGRVVIDDLSITLPDRGVVSVVGDSGSGKTTFLRLLLGLVKPKSGKVEGVDDKRIAVVFQEDRLLPWLTTLENVAIVCDSRRATEMLRKVELYDSINAMPNELSGGMQRRVAIARALCFGGDILIMDEPFKGLDDALKRRIAMHIKGKFKLIVVAIHDRGDAELLQAEGDSVAVQF